MPPSCHLPGCGVALPKVGQRCPRCRDVTYCRKDHQKADWKQHKTVCKGPQKEVKELVPVLSKEKKAVEDMEELFDKMGIPVVDRPHFHEEYQARYPMETRGFCILVQEFKTKTGQIFLGKQRHDGSLLDRFGSAGMMLIKRWGIFRPELIEYLKSKPRVGQVWREYPENSAFEYANDGEVQQFHSMRNTITPSQELEKGKCYISIGFVDLGQLLEAEITGSEDALPVIWRGYEASSIAVARAKLVLSLLQGNLTEPSYPTDLVLFQHLFRSICRPTNHLSEARTT